MDIPERFHNAFKDYGGRFPEPERTPQLIYCLESMRNNIDLFQKTANININIYIDYVVNINLNAAVIKDGNYYFIGVFYGGIYILCDLFMRMLSSPNLLINYEDVSEEITRKIHNAQITDVEKLYLLIGENKRSKPFNIKRISIGEFLTVLSSNNLILHEFAHILLGHQDFKIQKDKNKELISPEFKQCLKYEADIFATNIGITNLLHRPITIGAEEEVLFLKENDSDKIYLWHFAVYSFWRLYGNNITNINNCSELTHPPIIVRQYNIMALALEIVLGSAKNELIKKDIHNILRNSAIEVEKSLAEISNQSINLDSFNSMFSPPYKEYHKHLNHILMKDVMPALKEYRYFDPSTSFFNYDLINLMKFSA